MSSSRTSPSRAERLLRLVAERTGLDLSGHRGTPFRAALAREARAAGEPDEERYAAALLDGRAPLAALVEELTVGETWFFRDPAQWSFVESQVIPPARERRARSEGDRFRAWSAGCATGEEPYSLAIVLHETGLRDGVHVVGTDLDETALARARAGVFSLWSLRGDATGRARRHLGEAGGKLVLAPEIARLVRLFPLNLAGGEYPSASRGLADLDLVLCRNVLIYLEPSRVRDVAARLFATLAPGGCLLTGASDPILSRLAPFEVRAGPHGLAYLRPEAAARAGPAAAGRRAPPPAPRPPARAPRPVGLRGRRPPPLPAREPLAEDAHALLDAGRPAAALAALDAAIARRPLDAQAHFERAVALTELGRLGEAEDACRRALYLARGQPFVHFFTGMLRLRRRDAVAAARAFRTAAALAARIAPGEVVPLSHGMTAGQLVEAARAALRRGWPDGAATLG